MTIRIPYVSRSQALSQAIAALTSTVTDATSVLDTHVDQAVLASRIQAETTDAAGRLGEALTNMMTYTYAEMEKINGTAAAIHKQWLAAGGTHSFIDWRHWSDRTLYTTQWLLQVLFRGAKVSPVNEVILHEDTFTFQWIPRSWIICLTLVFSISQACPSVSSGILYVPA